MAEGLFRNATKNRKDIEVASAGVGAVYGQPPSAHSVEVLRPLSIDISDIRSQPLTDELVEWATHIFVMTRGHRDTIELIFPEAADKTYLVCELDDQLRRRSLDVPDPIGLGLKAYQETCETLTKALPSLINFIDSDSSETMTPSQPAPGNPTSNPSRTLRIAIGADHGGLELKEAVHKYLSKKGYMVSDYGAHSAESVDYPDFAEPVCKNVLSNEADFGILVCKSGIGMSIAANRYPHIRASLVDNPDDAKVTRQHNDANVLCLAANHVQPSEVGKIIDAFLGSEFEGGRHGRRVEKL